MLVPLLAVTLCVAPSEQADPVRLKRVAQELFEAERYEEARAILDTLYETAPDQEVLYARAVVYKRLGDCPAAIELFDEFLEGGPTEGAATVARAHIEECQATTAVLPPEHEATDSPPPATEAEQAPVSVPAPNPPRAMPPSPKRRRWFEDPAGGTLAASGVVATAIGVGLLVDANRNATRSQAASSELAFGDRVDRGRRFRRAGFGLTVAGSALIVGAAVRYIIVHRRRRE